jgi:hypothetical protein
MGTRLAAALSGDSGKAALDRVSGALGVLGGLTGGQASTNNSSTNAPSIGGILRGLSLPGQSPSTNQAPSDNTAPERKNLLDLLK